MTDDGLPIRQYVRRETVGLCVWCGQPTPVLAETPFRPDLGVLPLGLLCGAKMRLAYRDMQEGKPLDWARDGLRRIATLPQKNLPSGA